MNTLNFIDVYKKSSNVWVFILLAIAIWLAHFLQIGQFGIYSDDYFRVATALGMSGDRVWPTILEEGFRQGRPLHDGLIILFSFIGGKLGGLSVIHGIGFIILMLNSCLFYTFLKRIQPRDIFALSGAFAFALFPADPTEIFLTHSLGIQTSLTFFLIAIHLYLSHQKIASYIIITLSLFTYEKLFPIFLIAPLLTKKWDVKSKKTIIKHAIVLGIILVAVVVLRKITGESRIDDLNMIHAARRSIRDVLYGPVTSMGMFVYRAIETLLLWDFRTVDFKDIPKAKYIFVTLICLCTAGFTYVLSRIKSNEFYQELNSKQTWSNPIFYLQYPRYFQDMAKLSGIGLLALVLAYPLTLTTYAYIIDGQEAGRAHAAARIGASILCACVWSAIWFVATIYRKKTIAAVGLAGFFSLLIGFGIIVQQNYKISWDYQQQFWTDLVGVIPENLDNGDVILVEKTALKQPVQIDARVQFFPRILEQIYQFPEDWMNPPTVYALTPNWKENILEGDRFELDRSTIMSFQEGYNRQVQSTDVIFLENQQGKLVRRTLPLVIENREFPLKLTRGVERASFPKGHLYSYLIFESEVEP